MASSEEVMCRLCFASENSSPDVTFSPINPHLYFLNTLMRISLDTDKPQKICSTCDFQVESAKLLRKRLKFSEFVWNYDEERRKSSVISSAICDPGILLNCHVCGHSGNHNGLKVHILAKHRSSHVSGCSICRVLVGSGDSRTTEEEQTTPALEEVFVCSEAPSANRRAHGPTSGRTWDRGGEQTQPNEALPLYTRQDDQTELMDTEIRLKRFACPLCSYHTGRNYALKRHITNIHPELAAIRYKETDKYHKYDGILSDFSKPIPHTCIECGKAFKKVYSAKRHVSTQHKNDEPEMSPNEHQGEIDDDDQDDDKATWDSESLMMDKES